MTKKGIKIYKFIKDDFLSAEITGHKNVTTGHLEMGWGDKIGLAKMGLGSYVVDNFFEAVDKDGDKTRSRKYIFNADRMESYLAVHENIEMIGDGISLYLDGDQWCAVRSGFMNLQESPAGFGRTQKIAVKELFKDEKKESTSQLEIEEAIARATKESGL